MGEMRDSREFGTNELPSKEQELSRLRAENERLTEERDEARAHHEYFAVQWDEQRIRAEAAEKENERLTADVAFFREQFDDQVVSREEVEACAETYMRDWRAARRKQ